MKDSPNISFVIPAYNAATTLAEAVDSIFDGNFTDGDEVVIVDDTSTDATKSVADDLAKKYSPHITVIPNAENKGCPASRNVGIRAAKNDLIFNLDSDNVLAPHSIERLKKGLIESNADVAAFNEYRYFKTNHNKVTHRWICNPGVFSLADILAGGINAAPGGNYLYRKSTWQKIGGYWEYGKGLHEAWGFSLKMLFHGAKFFVVPGTFYFHRYSHQSLFVRENKKKDEAVIVSNKFIAPALHLLDQRSQDYVKNTPEWFELIEKHPLYLADGSKGKNGKIVYTSIVKTIVHCIRK